MKNLVKYFRKSLFTLLFLQMLNISFNYVNIYNGGQSGFRHKIALNSNELTEALKVMACLGVHSDGDNSEDRSHHIFLENFDLGFFVPQVDFPAITPEGGSTYISEISIRYKDHLADLHSPPPKVSKV